MADNKGNEHERADFETSNQSNEASEARCSLYVCFMHSTTTFSYSFGNLTKTTVRL